MESWRSSGGVRRGDGPGLAPQRDSIKMQTRGARIAGLGAYVPEKILTNDDLTRIVDTNDAWIVEHTGIRERHVLADDQACSDMAVLAAERALEDAGLTPQDIGLVIVATVTGDMILPATACIVQDRLGIKGAAAFDLTCGCTGWVQALITGAQFVQTGSYEHALVIGAEALTRVTDWTDRATCVLFGDGACAAVLSACEPDEGLLSFAMDTDGGAASLLYIPAGGSARRLTPELLAAHDDCIRMEGHEVFKYAVRGCPAIAAEALAKAGISPGDVDVAIPHQANLRIIDAAAKRLDIPYERMVISLEKYGNTSSASIGIALDEYKREHGLKAGDIVLMVGFGAGFSLAAAVFRWA
jgi:3-oxoacyl-[acyl-carrier-protein] synthase III